MPEPNRRLIVRVLQGLVSEGLAFASDADLVEALKVRCARLKVPYTGRFVQSAIDQLERGGRARSLIGPPPVVRRRHPAPSPTGPPLTRSEATRVCRQLWARYHAEHGLTRDDTTAR